MAFDSFLESRCVKPATVDPCENGLILQVHEPFAQFPQDGILVRKIAVQRWRREPCPLADKVCGEFFKPDFIEKVPGGLENEFERVLGACLLRHMLCRRIHFRGQFSRRLATGLLRLAAHFCGGPRAHVAHLSHTAI